MAYFFKVLSACLSLLAAAGVLADIYMHNPRGSNNRLNTPSGNRKNANRLFDSQNNAKGGYNVGELGSEQAKRESQFYKMVYFQSGANAGEESLLTLEMSYQHGCGVDELGCSIVLQYMCQPENTAAANSWQIRDGSTEEAAKFTPPRTATETLANIAARQASDSTNNSYGQHESWDNYNQCYLRKRNEGLFTADQRILNSSLGYSSSIYTRQNSKGKRYGYECPEERDYYPYWHPNGWKDLAVLVDNPSTENCAFFRSNSFSGRNTLGVCAKADGRRDSAQLQINNPADCTNAGFRWILVNNYLEKWTNITTESACTSRSNSRVTFIWAVPFDSANFLNKECLVAVPPVDCQKAPRSKANHLGLDSSTGEYPRYQWSLPYFPSQTVQNCVLRMRYNTTNDGEFNHKTTDSDNNQVRPGEVAQKYRLLFKSQADEVRKWKNATMRQIMTVISDLRVKMKEEAEEEIAEGQSPVRQNPRVSLFEDFPELTLAINTDQTGRVFQDRSHVFRLAPRPREVPAGRKIYNLNVRGKRGNIVQAYNAVEYDFIPNILSISSSDLIHIQWTGSNHQVGDGQGQALTDRSNIVQIADYAKNYPLYGSNITMWKNARVIWTQFQSPSLYPEMTFQTDANNQRSFNDVFSAKAKATRIRSFLNNAIADQNGATMEPPREDADMHPYDREKFLDDEMNAAQMPTYSMRKKRQANAFVPTPVGPNGLTDQQLALAMSSAGYYWCPERIGCPNYVPDSQVLALSTKAKLNPTLDQASASFPGVLLSLNRGTYFYMSTRNNKFTNRSQKGRILVS